MQIVKQRQREGVLDGAGEILFDGEEALPGGDAVAEFDARLFQAGAGAEGWQDPVYQLQPLKGPAQPGDVLAVHLAVNGSPMKYLLIEDPIPGWNGVCSERRQLQDRGSSGAMVVLVYAAGVPR